MENEGGFSTEDTGSRICGTTWNMKTYYAYSFGSTFLLRKRSQESDKI